MKRVDGAKQRILDFIKQYSSENGYPPTVREIASHFGYRSTKNVFVHLKDLEESGAIKRNPKEARAMEVVEEYRDVPILGSVAAGQPLLSEEYREGVLRVPSDVRGRFFLRVNGESMIDAGILDGDLLLVDDTLFVDNGEIGVFRVNGSVTVKKIKRISTGRIMLKPENRQMNPIEVDLKRDEFQIVGKVVGHMRIMK